MIASQKIGKSFMGALNYNLKKLNHPDRTLRAELLDTNFTSMDSWQIKKEVELLRSLKPNLNRYVYHTSLNFHKDDLLDNKKLLAIAHDYLRENGYSNNQYLIFRHHDAEHPHLHLLVNRISFDGTVVSDSNNYKRSEAILRKLETKYHLTTVESSSKAALKAANKNEIEMVIRTGQPSQRMVLQELLNRIVPKTSISLQEFIKRSEEVGIHLLFNQASTGRITGITYFYNGFKAKGQALGNRYKWAELIKRINYEQIRDSAAVSQANDRTRAKYGTATEAGEQQSNEQRGKGTGMVPENVTANPFTGPATGQRDSLATDESDEFGGSESADAKESPESNEDAAVLDHSGNGDLHVNDGSINIQIADDEDDAKKRRRRRM